MTHYIARFVDGPLARSERQIPSLPKRIAVPAFDGMVTFVPGEDDTVIDLRPMLYERDGDVEQFPQHDVAVAAYRHVDGSS